MERYLRGDAKRCRKGFKYTDPYCNPNPKIEKDVESYPWKGVGTRCKNGFKHKKKLCVRSKKRRLIVEDDTVYNTASAKKSPENLVVDKPSAKNVKTVSKNPFVDMSPSAFQAKKVETPEKFDWFGNPLGFDRSVKNKTPNSVKFPVKSKNRTKRRRVNSVGLLEAVPTKTERAYDYSPTEKKKSKNETPKRNALARWWNPTPKKNTIRKNKTPKKGWFGQDLTPTPPKTIVTQRTTHKTATPRYVF